MKVQARPMPKKMPWAQWTPMCRFCSPTWCIFPAWKAASWALDGCKDSPHHIKLWGRRNWNVSVQDPPHKASPLAAQDSLWPAEEKSLSLWCTTNLNYSSQFTLGANLTNITRPETYLPILSSTLCPCSREACHWLFRAKVCRKHKHCL